MEGKKECRTVKFRVYGSEVVGEYVSEEDGCIVIIVESDSSGVSERGETARIHNSFLVEDSANE